MCLLAPLDLLQQKLHFYSSLMGQTLKILWQGGKDKDESPVGTLLEDMYQSKVCFVTHFLNQT